MTIALLVLLAALQQPETTSLLGKPLYRPPVSAEEKEGLEERYEEARRNFDKDPSSEDNAIWLGRRLAYLGRFRDAIQVYSDALKKHPRSYRLLRHRGHRYITLRQFDRAIADLDRAATLVRGIPPEVEPDGLPNPRGVPHGTAQTNIWYHLGLARYLKGEFAKAAAAYRECLNQSANDEMRVAASDWLYMSLRRAGREAEAEKVLDPIQPGLDIQENTAYYHRLLMYKGLKKPDELLGQEGNPTQIATQGYGVANWYFYGGDKGRAEAIFRKIVEGSAWPAFGYIAAESDLARLK